jgi:hypothetical protein
MKKSKLLILGLIALMLAGGLALASCEKEEEGCNQGGDCSIEYSNKSGCTQDSCNVKKNWNNNDIPNMTCDC